MLSHRKGVKWCRKLIRAKSMIQRTKRSGRPTKEKSARASVSFSPDVYATLEQIAKEKKVSVAWVVRDARRKNTSRISGRYSQATTVYKPMASFYEFFAGGGMARAGLGSRWACLFANDFDENKGASYATNWGAETLKIGDVAKLRPSDLPGLLISPGLLFRVRICLLRGLARGSMANVRERSGPSGS